MNGTVSPGPGASPARALFEEIKRDGVAWMDRAKEDKREETGYLDFKRATYDPATHQMSGTGKIAPDDKVNLAKVISGFANSDGGVCVWGVDCSRGADGVDVVQRLDPIAGVRRFLSDLDSSTNSVVAGAIGVEHLLIPTADDSEKGFIATYVPRHDGPPIMALAKDMNCYWYRSGSSFRRMESWMVAERFARRPQPKIDFYCRCHPTDLSDHWGFMKAHFVMTVGLTNTGRGIASHPALLLSMEHPLYVSESELNGSSGLPRVTIAPEVSAHHKAMYAGGSDAVVYPGTSRDVTRIKFAMRNEAELRIPKVFTLKYDAFCDGDRKSGEYVLLAKPVGNTLMITNPEGERMTSKWSLS